MKKCVAGKIWPMGKLHKGLEEKHIQFIKEQKIFFTATAAADGRVNLSPKGMDSFRVLGPNKAVWINFTGSGNETAAHLHENNRITVMFCSFDEEPLILRLYAKAKALHPRDPLWNQYVSLFSPNTGIRQAIVMDIDTVQTSCGYSIPFYEYKGERDRLLRWIDERGKDGVEAYWEKNNAFSLDEKPTYIVQDPD